MRRFLIVLAITLLPSFAIAGHGGGGHGGGGHMGGGWGGGHMGGGWGGHMGGGWGKHSMAMAAFHHGRFVHRHNRFFFAGGPFFAAYGYGYDCWRWVPTAWGPRRIWVCGDYY